MLEIQWPSDNYYFQPVAIKTTGVYGKSTAPFLSYLAKKIVDISGDPRERQWLHQCLSLAVVRENTASILACVQAWSDLSHPQCINQCSCPSLASLQYTAIAFRMSVFSVSFIVFSMFFMLSVKPLCNIVLLDFSAILSNLILFIFHVHNTTQLYYCLLYNLFVICLSNTHTMAVLHHGLYNFTVFFSLGMLIKKKIWPSPYM